MRRVVITGLGIVSSIGNNADEVTQSLKDARSGISASPDFAENGFAARSGAARHWALNSWPNWSTAAPCAFCHRVARGTMSP